MAHTRAGITAWAFGFDNASDIEASEKIMLLSNHNVNNYGRLTTPDGGVRLDAEDTDSSNKNNRSPLIVAGYSSDQEDLGCQAQQAVFETGTSDGTKRGLTVGNSTRQIQMTGTNCIEYTFWFKCWYIV